MDRDLPVARVACHEIRESVMQELDVPEDQVSEVHAWGCDVTNTDQVRQTISEIAKKFGGVIDIFVGAAGMYPCPCTLCFIHITPSLYVLQFIP
jgi:NAD(P)-dependent dehydrogenase (short-subunit alcohol dehydrogenase family)